MIYLCKDQTFDDLLMSCSFVVLQHCCSFYSLTSWPDNPCKNKDLIWMDFFWWNKGQINKNILLSLVGWSTKSSAYSCVTGRPHRWCLCEEAAVEMLEMFMLALRAPSGKPEYLTDFTLSLCSVFIPLPSCQCQRRFLQHLHMIAAQENRQSLRNKPFP